MTIQVLAMTSLNPEGENALSMYLSVVGPLMQAAGAHIIERFEHSENIVGVSAFEYITLIEYPDEASIKMVFESEAYQSLDDIKKLAFSQYQVSVLK